MIQMLLKKFRRKPKAHKTGTKTVRCEVVCEKYLQALELSHRWHLPLRIKSKGKDVSKRLVLTCNTYKELRENFRAARKASDTGQVVVSKIH